MAKSNLEDEILQQMPEPAFQFLKPAERASQLSNHKSQDAHSSRLPENSEQQHITSPVSINPQLSSTPNNLQEKFPPSVAKSLPKQSIPDKTQNSSVSQKRRMTSPLSMDPQPSTPSQPPETVPHTSPNSLSKHINSQNTKSAGMESTISINPQESIVQYNMPTVNTTINSMTRQNSTLNCPQRELMSPFTAIQRQENQNQPINVSPSFAQRYGHSKYPDLYAGSQQHNISLLQSPSNDQVSIPEPQSTIRASMLFPDNQPIYLPNISSQEPTHTTFSESSSNSSMMQSAQLISSSLLGNPGSNHKDISFDTPSMNSFSTPQSYSSNRWTYSPPDADELYSLSERVKSLEKVVSRLVNVVARVQEEVCLANIYLF